MHFPFLRRSAAKPSGSGNSFFQRPRRHLPAVAIATLFIGLMVVSGCEQATPATHEKKAVEVVVTTPIADEVTDYQDFTGRLDALKTVDIRARVSGFIMTAPFKEGDVVEEGKLLFLIDPRTYQASFDQAEANLKQAVADRNLQQRNTFRAQKMIEGRSIAQEDYETTLATYEKSKATVGSMEAARDMAKLYLGFTKVAAPLTGRISRRLVDPGNLVIADNTMLTTIVSDNPLYAYFDVDERTYLNLMGTTSPGQNSWFSGLQFPVLMQLANEDNFAHAGKVNFIDNRVSATTGTIHMRGEFENPTGVLKSGLFVRIRLPIGKPYQGLLISGEALLHDQGRKYVYVVNDKNEVVYRPVVLGQEIGGLVVIKQGLAKGERVIISGMQRVRPGAQVQIKLQDPPKPPESPLGKLLSLDRDFRPAKQADKGPGKPGVEKAGRRASGSAPSGS